MSVCKLCGSHDVQLAEQWECWGHGDSGTVYWMQCKGCGTRGPKYTGYNSAKPVEDSRKAWDKLHSQSDRP